MKNMNTSNTNALRARILSQYETLEDFCDRVNVDLDKINGKEEMCLDDIVSIRCALNLTAEEAVTYFFPEMEPEEHNRAMANLLALRGVVERLEGIENGLTALDVMTGKIKDIGDTVSNESFQGAFGFILDGVRERLTNLRAELTAKYFKESAAIGK